VVEDVRDGHSTEGGNCRAVEEASSWPVGLVEVEVAAAVAVAAAAAAPGRLGFGWEGD